MEIAVVGYDLFASFLLESIEAKLKEKGFEPSECLICEGEDLYSIETEGMYAGFCFSIEYVYDVYSSRIENDAKYSAVKIVDEVWSAYEHTLIGFDFMKERLLKSVDNVYVDFDTDVFTISDITGGALPETHAYFTYTLEDGNVFSEIVISSADLVVLGLSEDDLETAMLATLKRKAVFLTGYENKKDKRKQIYKFTSESDMSVSLALSIIDYSDLQEQIGNFFLVPVTNEDIFVIPTSAMSKEDALKFWNYAKIQSGGAISPYIFHYDGYLFRTD